MQVPPFVYGFLRCRLGTLVFFVALGRCTVHTSSFHVCVCVSAYPSGFVVDFAFAGAFVFSFNGAPCREKAALGDVGSTYVFVHAWWVVRRVSHVGLLPCGSVFPVMVVGRVLLHGLEWPKSVACGQVGREAAWRVHACSCFCDSSDGAGSWQSSFPYLVLLLLARGARGLNVCVLCGVGVWLPPCICVPALFIPLIHPSSPFIPFCFFAAMVA